jgi:hypothetical protein
MSGRAYTPGERARFEVIAIALRRTGADMQTVTDATGVSLSTLHRWAREHEWRLHDLAEAETPVGTEGLPVEGAPPAVAPAGSAEAGDDAGEEDIPDPAAVAEHLEIRALQAAASGDLLKSSRAIRLSSRFRGLAETWAAEDSAAAATHGSPLTPEELEELRDELRQRIDRRLKYEEEALARRRADAAAGRLPYYLWQGDEGVPYPGDPRVLKPEVYELLLADGMIPEPI